MGTLPTDRVGPLVSTPFLWGPATTSGVTSFGLRRNTPLRSLDTRTPLRRSTYLIVSSSGRGKDPRGQSVRGGTRWERGLGEGGNISI